MRVDENSQPKKPKDSVFGFLFDFFRSVVWAMIIGFTMNCVLWHIEGYEKVMNTLDRAYATDMKGIYYRNQAFSDRYQTYQNAIENKGSRVWDDLLTQVPMSLLMNTYTQDLWNHIKLSTYRIVDVWNETAKDVLAKTVSVLVSLWVFVFSSLLGAMDGLLNRYKRTCEGGRESTYIYHKVSSSMYKIPLAILVVFLSIPLDINPEIVVILLSITFFMYFYITTSSLKKYL